MASEERGENKKQHDKENKLRIVRGLLMVQPPSPLTNKPLKGMGLVGLFSPSAWHKAHSP